jgi:membrane-bound lytic murein transglycosylase D
MYDGIELLNMRKTGALLMPGPAVTVSVLKGVSPAGGLRFVDSFIIGRTSECGLQIKDSAVSRNHVKVEFDGTDWWLKDLQSANGTFLDGLRVQHMPLPATAVIELGREGPLISIVQEGGVIRMSEPLTHPEALPGDAPMRVSVQLSPPKQHAEVSSPDLISETQIMKRYFAKAETDSENASEQTIMFRRAFQRAHQKKSQKYYYALGVALLLLIVAGGTILFQKQKLQKLRATAENLFYAMKSLELQIGKLEEVVLLNSDPGQLAELQAKRGKVQNLEKEYDNFVKELGIYAKMSPEDRAIMRVAHNLGECEVNMPKGFSDEVKKQIALWKSSERLPKALSRAQQKGFAQLIARILKDNNLAPQFFFIALQESNFDELAVGPATRVGSAKGLWQLIAPTAQNFGLHIGPLQDQSVYDPQDERFEPAKATLAAARYLKMLNNTDAQASGLLVMAAYNWGEGNVQKYIDQMPPNPRERNFWRLLSIKNIPKETYDYVYSVFSAAVICQDPKLFGFDCSCPVYPGADLPVLQGAGSRAM